MQPHTESINFGLFLSLNVSRMSHINDLIFWTYRVMQNMNYVETLFLFDLFNVGVFGGKKCSDRHV